MCYVKNKIKKKQQYIPASCKLLFDSSIICISGDVLVRLLLGRDVNRDAIRCGTFGTD